MEVGVLSMRYAKAMIEYAQEKGVEDRLYNEFFTLSHSFRVQPGLREVLDNPVVSVKDKLALICTAADGNGESLPETETHRSRQTDYGSPGGQGDRKPDPFRSSTYSACPNGTGYCDRSLDRGGLHLRYQ